MGFDKSTGVNSRDKSNRLVSLDALRGFDMLWIIGARSFAEGLANLKIPGISIVVDQLTHTKWNGFTFYDLIFPLFIYITGIALVLAIQKRLERGDDRLLIVKHILKRTVILFSLGILYNLGTSHWSLLGGIRIMGVLQRISLCYFFAALLVIYTKPLSQIVTVLGILIGYWIMMRFAAVPGHEAGLLTEQVNLAHYADNLLLPGKLYYGSWDPEGLLSTIPAVATCLLGVLTGYWLRLTQWRHGKEISPNMRTWLLFLAGLVLVISSLLINPIFPINKKIWTSSFVLLTGGLSAILMAVFYWVIDGNHHAQCAFPFVVIGMNSIFIYMVEGLIPFHFIYSVINNSHYLALLGHGLPLAEAVFQLLLEWLLLLFLYRRKIFIKI